MSHDQHIIYVSYARSDEDWVIYFINNLKVYLRKQLGEISDNFIWAKYYLLENNDSDRTEILRNHLKNSTFLLVILSNSYLKDTEENKIITLFRNNDNLIIVEHDKVERPNLLRATKGYQFWKLENKKVIRFANPKPNLEEKQYYQLLDQMARDIVEKSSVIQQHNEKTTVFLARTNKYQKERRNLKGYLIKQGFSVLPTRAGYNSIDYNQLKRDIKNSDFFIQLFDNENSSKTQCEIAKEMKLPILRWAENQHELNSDCPTAICTDIAAFKSEISRWIAKHKDNPKMQASSNTYLSPHIFIYATEEDRALAEQVQQQLLKDGMSSSLPPSQELGLSPQEIEESIEQDLLNCQCVIIISDEAPPTWVRQKILHCFKIQAKRYSSENTENMNVAVFNKPPPEGLEAKLGIKRANLYIWDCLEVMDNCMSEFKKVILS